MRSLLAVSLAVLLTATLAGCVTPEAALTFDPEQDLLPEGVQGAAAQHFELTNKGPLTLELVWHLTYRSGAPVDSGVIRFEAGQTLEYAVGMQRDHAHIMDAYVRVADDPRSGRIGGPQEMFPPACTKILPTWVMEIETDAEPPHGIHGTGNNGGC